MNPTSLKEGFSALFFARLQERSGESPDSSYTAKLVKGDRSKLLQKIGEEAVEVVLAGAEKNRKKIVAEVADLYYHTMVLLVADGISPDEVQEQLKKRMGVSGLDEKKSRRSKEQ